MAKATTTIRQALNYQVDHAAWFAANQDLFNRVTAFYFEVIQAHAGVLDLSNKEALTALEMLTHTTEKNRSRIMPLEEILEDIPAMFRRAATNAALGSARSFYSNLAKWRKRREKVIAKGKKFHERPPVPPRAWNKSATLYAGHQPSTENARQRNTNEHGTAQDGVLRMEKPIADMTCQLRFQWSCSYATLTPENDDTGVSEAAGL